MNHAEWTERLDSYEARIKAIAIPAIPTEADIKSIIAKLDNLYTSVIFDLAQIKTDLEKVNGTIERCHAKAKTGANEDARKLASIAAAENYFPPGAQASLNLYRLKQEIFEHKERIDAAKQVMDKKLNLLQMSYGTLKMESQL